MIVITFCPFLLLFSLAFGSATPVRDQCEGDTQCMPGYYCFIETGYCAQCTNCEVYNRKKSWRSCSKNPIECGTCLSGFEEEILAGGKTRDWCIRNKSAPESQAHHSDTVKDTQSYLTWPLAIGFFIILTLFYAVCWRNWRGANINRLVSQTEQPPPYSSLFSQSASHDVSSSSSSSSAAADNEGVSCSCHINGNASTVVAETSNPQQLSLSWQQCKEEHLQEALPFRFPEDPSNPLMESDDDSNTSDHESLVDDVVGTLSQERNIELEDETTMPSDWTPYPHHNSEQEETQQGCDNVDSGNVENVSEPPTKKRKADDETTESPETADK